MDEEILKLGTIHQCNCCLGGKTLHPLVSVIDLSKTGLQQHHLKLEFYTILFSEYSCKNCICEYQQCDYSDGTLLFLTPGQSISIKKNDKLFLSQGRILVFHPSLIQGTSLEEHIKNYSFFFYHPEEALHLSCREKEIIKECLQQIEREINRPVDHHSKTLISRYIELLLDHCNRYYERQFITRHEANKIILEKTEILLDEYFATDQARTSGLPSTPYCAELLNLSTHYLNDLLKYETGTDMEEYIRFKRIYIARKLLLNTDKTINQIAEELGFPTTRYFNNLFRQITGKTPGEFRLIN